VHAAIAGAAEDAEDVVLGGGEVVGFEEFFESAHEVIGGANEVQEEFLLDALERFDLVDFIEEFSTHATRLGVQTNKSKS
jgi:hypothetical protein